MQLDVLIEQKSLIKGDAKSISIAAASILAKTHRDARMNEWDVIYSGYGLAQHKGYGTPEHLEALRRLGPTPATPQFICAGARIALLVHRRHPKHPYRYSSNAAVAKRSDGISISAPEDLYSLRTRRQKWRILPRG